MTYASKIIADSISPDDIRLTTFEVTYPRMVHAELMTHRVFSRNSASSRAIPVKTMIENVISNPVLPVYWGANQKGMQAMTELSEDQQELAVRVWLDARDAALVRVQSLLDLNVHKQLANRLLEPWMWITVIVTATEWDNFFHLRVNPMAQPEIHRIAKMMDKDYAASTPQQLDYGQWHLPYVRPEEHSELSLEQLIKLSAARCARVSYLTQDGLRDNEADYTLYNRLLQGGHMSPYEHPARPMTEEELELYTEARYLDDGLRPIPFLGNFKGWVQHRKEIDGEEDMQAPKD